MRGIVTAAALMLAGSALAQGTSVWDGVYTEAQAQTGSTDFAAHCAACHGAALTGTGEAPPLEGAQFLGDFNGETVGDLFDRIRTTMPQDQPGSLTRAQYARILAFVLKFNSFPAGARPLDQRSEYLKAVSFDASAPRPVPEPAAAAQPPRTPP
jgi:mono/diheme cytochrome c family protein